MKNKSVRIPLRLRIVLLSILMALVVVHGIFAKERQGIVRNISHETLAAGGSRLFIDVDTTGNRIPDISLIFPSPNMDSVSRNLQAFLERGMLIVFDDEGHKVFRNGDIQVDGFNTISIDGSNMLTLFPNEAARFKFAAEAQRRTQAPAQSQSAEERRVAELEAELQRLKQGR